MVNREKIVARLDAAETEARKLRELLQLFDSIEQEEGKGKVTTVVSGEHAVRSIKTKRKPTSQGKTRNMELGKLVRKTFLSVNPEESTDVPTVVKLIQPTYPEIDYDDLSKLVGGIARRLKMDNKLKIDKEGSGRTPHTYKLVS